MTISPMRKMMFWMWLRTLLFAFPVFIISSIYIGFERGFNIYLINRVAATMAVTLIAFSLSLASLSYFIKFFQRFLGYRMYLGVLGFFFGFLHALFSLFFYLVLDSEKPAYVFDWQWPILGSITIPNQLAFLIGLTGLCIFTFMALISMKVFIVKLGGKLWRELLRYLGFTALFLVLVHFFIKDFSKWIHPQEWGNGLPPSSIFIFLLGAFVLGLRLILALSLVRKRH